MNANKPVDWEPLLSPGQKAMYQRELRMLENSGKGLTESFQALTALWSKYEQLAANNQRSRSSVGDP